MSHIIRASILTATFMGSLVVGEKLLDRTEVRTCQKIMSWMINPMFENECIKQNDVLVIKITNPVGQSVTIDAGTGIKVD
jgi:hypothetical protein